MESENQGRGMPHLTFQLQEQNANSPVCSKEYLECPSRKSFLREDLKSSGKNI